MGTLAIGRRLVPSRAGLAHPRGTAEAGGPSPFEGSLSLQNCAFPPHPKFREPRLKLEVGVQSVDCAETLPIFGIERVLVTKVTLGEKVKLQRKRKLFAFEAGNLADCVQPSGPSFCHAGLGGAFRFFRLRGRR